MSLTKRILSFAAPLPKFEQFRRFLFIGPHPDDIEIGAGATAAKLAAAGKDICFLICTDGCYGDQNLPAGSTLAQVAVVRKQESIDSAAFLGVKDVRFLNLCDGGFYEKKELLQGIAGVVGDFKPDVILAPDPCVSSECHPDHLNVGEAARRIAYMASNSGIMARWNAEGADVKALAFYMTAKPNQYICTRGGWLQKQLHALSDYHISQYPAGGSALHSVELYLKIRSVDFGVRAHCGCAEGFRVLGATHMHCLPEAGER